MEQTGPKTEVSTTATDHSHASPPSEHRKRKRSDRGGGHFRQGRGSKPLQHGSHANKKRRMGRVEHNNEQLDRRGRNEEQQEKNRKKAERGPSSALPAPFPAEELEAEERRPKRKVAVMVGYSGTGYKGMQFDHEQKTIEGDLFGAFVKAGAISKVNADDPKKSSLVRCARTDKGVHAAGNVISLKLIIEDEDIVEKINSHLSEQIRIWGIQRTTGSFSCYQACDSRWYEYLIPTHTFLPPHPSSHLAKKLVEYAKQHDDLDEHNKRQAEVAGFWAEVEEKQIKPVLETLDDSIRPLVMEALYSIDAVDAPPGADAEIDAARDGPVPQPEPMEAAAETAGTVESTDVRDSTADVPLVEMTSGPTDKEVSESVDAVMQQEPGISLDDQTDGSVPLPASTIDRAALETAIKALKKAYIDAKKAYRIDSERQARVQAAFKRYVGTHKYHNYTVQKKFTDRSAQRFIKSFTVADKPVIIHDTEWLSLKVHGQSFMMHQIRKMVGMAALAVRCGTNLDIINQSFGNVVMRIPKVPGLGLLLERPVFDSYNDNQAANAGRDRIDFARYEKELAEFKEREIYQRIFREEAQGNQFHSFFTHLDNYKDPIFLYLTSGGLDATRRPFGGINGGGKSTQAAWEDQESEDDGDASNGEG